MTNGTSDTPITRFLGGSPGRVALKLLIISIVVGALLHWGRLSPLSLLRGVETMVRELIGTGWDAVRNLATFALYGALVVVPIWLLARLLARKS